MTDHTLYSVYGSLSTSRFGAAIFSKWPLAIAMVLGMFLMQPMQMFAQVNGDFRSAGTGNWNAAASWQRYNGSAWEASGVGANNPGQTPGATNSVWVQVGHIISLTQNEACLNLHLNNTAAARLSIGTFTLALNGKLRAYSGVVNTIPGTNGVPPATANWITSSSGKISVVGNTRVLTVAAEWSGANAAATVASGNGFDLELNLNAGQTVTCNTDICTRNLSIAAGSLTMGGTTNIFIDQGAANVGSLTVASGATLNMNTGSIKRAIAASASSHFGTFTSNGTVNFTAAVGNVGAGTVTFNGTVGYTAAAAQTFVTRGSNTGGAVMGTYNDVTVSGSGIKTLAQATTINGNLTISAGTLADGAFLVTGPGAASGKTLDMSAAVATGLTLTNITANPFPAFQTYSLNPTLSTVSYNANATQNIRGGLSYGNLTLATGGAKSPDADLTVQGTLTITAGTLAGANRVVTVNGNVVNTGGYTGTGTSKIRLTGGSAAHNLTGTGAYTVLELDDTNGATAAANFTVNSSLILTSGTFRINAGITTTLTGNIAAGGSGLLGGSATSNLTIGGTGSLGNTLNFDQTGTLPNLGTVSITRATSGIVSLGSNLTINGTLTLNAAGLNFYIGANLLTFNGQATPLTLTAGSFNGGTSSDISFTGGNSVTAFPLVTGGIRDFTVNRSAQTITLATTAPLTIHRNLDIAAGTFATNTVLVTGPGAGTGTFSMNSGLAAVFTMASTAVNPFPVFQTYDFHPTLSTVSYLGANTANVQNISTAPTYGNLITSNGTVGFQKLFTGNTLVRGSLTTNNGFLSYETFTVTVNGSLSNAGTHNAAATGKILLSGGSVQHQIGGTGGYGNIELNDAVGALTTANVAVNGNLDVVSGTFTIGNFTFTQPFGKKTTVTSSLTKNVGTGLVSIGEIEVLGAGTYNMPTNPSVTIKGNLTNAGTFTAGTGLYTFSNIGTITSPSSLAFSSVSSNGTYINNATMNVSGAFTLSTGTTSFTNNEIVTIGGTMTLSTSGGAFHNNDSLLVSSTAAIGGNAGAVINNNNGGRFHLASASVTPAIGASAATNRVRYFGASAQTVRGGTYYDLAIDKSALATAAAGIIVNNDFSILNGQFADGGFAVTGNATGDFTLAAGTTYTTTRSLTPWLPSAYTNIQLNATSTVNYNSGTLHNIVQNPNGTAITNAYGHLGIAGAVTKTVSGGNISSNNLTINAGTLADGGNTITVAGTLSSNGTHSGTGKILMQGSSAQSIAFVSGTGTRQFGNIEVNNSAGVTLAGTFSNIYQINGALTLTAGSLNVDNATLQFSGGLLAGTPALLTTTTGSNLIYAGSTAGHVIPSSVDDLRQLTVSNTTGVALSDNLNLHLNAAGALTLTGGRLRLGANNLTVLSTNTGAITGNALASMVVADGTGQLRRAVSGAVSYIFPVGDESGGTIVAGNTGADYSPVTIAFSVNATPRIIGVRVTDDKHPSDATANDYISRYWSFTDSQAGVGTYTYTGTYTYSTTAPSDLVGLQATAKLNSWDQTGMYWTQFTTTTGTSTFIVSNATEISGPLTDVDVTARVNDAITYTWLPTSGSNSWAVSTNWSPTRFSPQPTDILQFTKGGTSTATNIPSQVVQRVIVDNTDIGANTNTNVTFVSAAAGNNLDINGPTATDNLVIAAGATLDLGGLTPTFNLRFQTMPTQQGDISGTLIVRNGNTFLTNTITSGNGVQVKNGASIRNIGTTANTGGTVTSSAASLFFLDGATYSHERDGGAIPTATYYRVTPLIDNSTIRVTGMVGNALSGLSGNVSNLEWDCTGQTVAQSANGALNLFGNLTIDNTGTNVLQDGGNLIQGPSATSGKTFTLANSARFTMTNGTTTTTVRQAGSFPLFQTYTFSPTSVVNYNGNASQPVQGNLTYGNLSLGSNTKTANAILTAAGNLTISAGTLADGGNTLTVIGNLSSNGTHSGAGKILMQGSSAQSISFVSGTGTRQFGNIEVNNSAGVTLAGTFSNIYQINGALTLTAGNFNVDNATLQFSGGLLAGTPALLTTTTGSNLIYAGSTAGHVIPSSVDDLRQLTLNNTNGLSLSSDLNIHLNLAGALTLTSGRLRLGANDLSILGSITTAITGGALANMVVADGTGQLRRATSTGSYLFPVGDESGGTIVAGNTGADYSPLTLNFTVNATPRIIGVRVTDDKHPNDATANDYISRYWSFTDSQAGVGTYTYTGTYTYSTTAPSDLVGTHASAKLNSWDQAGMFWTQYTTTNGAPSFVVTGATETSGPLADVDMTARVNSAITYTWQPTSGSNSWTVSTNWDPPRVSPQPTDILQFTEGGNPTVTNVPAQTIGSILVGDGGNGPTDAVFTSTVSSTLTINNTTGTTFNIESGSALRLSSAGTIGTLVAFTGTNVATVDGTLELSVNTNGNNTFTATNSTTTVNGTLINGGTVNSTTTNLIFSGGSQYDHIRNGGVIALATRAATSVYNITGITTTNPTGLTGTFGHFIWNNTGQVPATTGVLNGALIVNGRLEVLAGTLNDNGNLVTGNATVGNFFRVGANGTYTTTRATSPWLPSAYTNIQLHATSTVNYNSGTLHNIVQNPNGAVVVNAYGHLGIAGAVVKTVSGGNISSNNLTINAGTLADGGNTITVAGNLSSNGTHSGAGKILMQGSSAQSISFVSGTGTRQFGNIEVNNSAGVTLAGTFSNIYQINGALTLTAGSLNVDNATLQFSGGLLAGTPALLTTTTGSNLIYSGAVAGHAVPSSVTDIRQLTLNNTNGLSLSGDLNIHLNLAGALTLTSGRLRLGANDLSILGTITTAITGGALANMVVADGAGQLRRAVSGAVSYLFPVGDESGGTIVAGNTGADYSPVTIAFSVNATPRIIGVRVTDDKHPSDATASNYISRYWSFTDSQSGVGTYTYTGTYTYSTTAPSDLVGLQATAKLNSWDQTGMYWTQFTTTTGTSTFIVSNATEISGPLTDVDVTARVNDAITYTWLPTSGSNSWAVSTNWSPTRFSPQPTDILQFTKGGTSTATNIPSQVVQRVIVDNTDIGANTNTNVTFVSAAAGNNLDINGPTATDNLVIAAGATLDLGGLTPTFNLRFQTMPTQQGDISGTLIVRNGNTFLTNTITSGNGVQVKNGASIRNIGTTANTGGTVTSSAASLFFLDGATYSHERDGGAIPTATYYRVTPLIDNSTIRVTGMVGNALSGLSGNVSNLEWDCTGQTVAQSANGALNLFGNLTIDNTGTNVLQDGGNLIQGPSATSGKTFTLANSARFTMTNGTTTTTVRQAGSFPLFQTYTFSPTSVVNYNGNASQPVQGNLTYGNLSLGSNTKTANAILTAAGNLTIGGTTFNNGGFVITVNGNVSNNSGHTGAGRILLTSGAAPHALTGIGAYTNLELNDTQGATMGGSFTVSGALTLATGALGIGANTLTLSGTVVSTSGLLSGISTSTLVLSGTVGGNMGSVGFATGGQVLNVLTLNRTGTTPSATITTPLSTTTLNLTSGVVDMGANTLTVTGTATGNITGGSNTSYVQGRLMRNLPTIGSAVTYAFPVGKSTYNQLRLINPITASSASVAVEVFDSAPIGGTFGFTITGLGNRYWETDLTSGTLTSVEHVELSRTTPVVNTSKVIGHSATSSGTYASLEGTVITATTMESVNPVDPALGYFVIADRVAVCSPQTVTGDLVISSDIILGNTIDVSGNFTVNSGVTITVPQGCPLIVNATNITMNGIINANAAGRAGGAGGSGGNAFVNCSNEGDNTYTGGLGTRGSAATGGGGGGAGTNGGNGNGKSRECGGLFCSGNDDGHFGGGGGGGGGKGGSYGGLGGNGGAGAAGAYYNNGNNPTQSTAGAGGTLGAVQGTDNGIDIDMGYGGGGAGGGGGGRYTGDDGGDGGNGGGAVSLVATGNLSFTGTINANGVAGAAGGNGSNNSSNNHNCSAGDCGSCDVCTSDETFARSGGAGGGAGGGSGGGIRLQAYGNMTLTGTLNARGGNGGSAGTPNTSNGTCHSNARGGAGGGGGRIKVILNPCATNNVNPTASVAAGNGGSGNLAGNSGAVGSYVNNIEHPSYTLLLAGDMNSTDQAYCASNINLTDIDADPSTGGAGTTAYQWYVSNTACGNPASGNVASPNAGWLGIVGATSEDLVVSQIQDGLTALGGGNGTFCFQRRTQSGICHDWTTTVTIILGADPTIGTQPVATTTVNVGDTPPALSIAATGGVGTFTYQWYSNAVNSASGGTSLGTANGAQTATLTIPTTVASDLYYYCEISQSVAGCGPLTSNTGRVTVNDLFNSWTGNISTAWNNPGNWSQSIVPTISDNAVIPTSPVGGNFPTVNIIGAEVADLEVQSGAIVNITTGNALTVDGVLDNEGTFHVTNGGSLVQHSGSALAGSGTFNVTRNGSSVYDFWSSPISVASPGFLSGTVYQYNPSSGTSDPSDDAFDPGWIAPGGNMTPGKGYAAYGAGIKTFTGTVNNGNVNIAVGSFPNPNVSYNLIGNPYPSGISVSSFLSANNSVLAVGSVYLWDDPGTNVYVTGDYAVRNNLGGTAGGGGNAPTGTIGTAQGFKVNVNANGNVQFTNAMRTASNTINIFRQIDTKLLWLSALSTDHRFNQTLVGFAEDGSDGNDWAYDAPKLNALGELSFYSYMDGEPFAIQGFGQFTQERIVPLGLNSSFQTSVTITLDSTENMNFEDIILEDRHLGIFNDLRIAPYVFQVSATTYTDRFFLHFAPQMVTSVDVDASNRTLSAHINNDILYVRVIKALTGTLKVFDMSGKMVIESSVELQPNSAWTIDVATLAKGVYSVLVQNDGGSQVAKVIR
jgi:putative NADPH-quinone reductase